MEKEEFARRMSQLRQAKGVSARDMSLSLGQSAGYINNIENGVNLLGGACRPHAAEAAESEPAAAHRPPAGTSGASGAGDEIKTQDQAGPAFYNFEKSGRTGPMCPAETRLYTA